MNRRLAAFIALTLISGVAPSTASTPEHIRAVNKIVFTEGTFRKSFDPAERKRFAKELASYWESFSNRIPRLSPSEQKWLDGEIASGSDERITSAMSRREFAISQIVQTATNCTEAYRDLENDIGINAKREALRWARTLSCYEEDLRTYLLNAGLIKRGEDSGPIKLPMFSLWPRTITGAVLGSVLDEPNFR